MEKLIKVNIKNLDIARGMLLLAGYYDSDSLSDEEVFEKVMDMIVCYGATWELKED